MSTITPAYRSLQQLLQSQSFSIDEYQREYKWSKENVDELLDDLVDKFRNCYDETHETSRVAGYEDYFLGSIIVSKRAGRNYLIDGQQRVTSLTLLLIHLYRIARDRGLTVAERLAPLIYSDNFGETAFNLSIPERLPVLHALFHNQPFTPDERDESIQSMYARYQDIVRRNLPEELGTALPHFIYWLMTKVGLIEISTDNDQYAYAIFETMNDRGKPLSPVDMLKAYLLAPVENADARRGANAIWKQTVLGLITWRGEHEPDRDSNCIKAWFRAQYAETIRERKAGSTDKDWELIGSEFHRWTRDNRDRLGLGKPAGNLAMVQTHFPFFARAYQMIMEAGRTYTPGLESVFYNAHNEFTWQTTVLLAPLVTTDDAETVRRKIGATATYLDIWLMRRVVCYVRVGYSATAYSMWKLCCDIRRKPLPELVAILTQKLNEPEDDAGFDGSPSRARSGVKGLALNQFTRRYIYHLLARLTAYVEGASGMADRFAEYVDRDRKNTYDIEHIWPDTYSRFQSEYNSEEEFQETRNNVAGLVLLPADVNRSYQDKPFEEKVIHYSGQNLYAASLAARTYEHRPQFNRFRADTGLPFKAYESFSREEQAERRELVRQLVKLVWSPQRLEEFVR